LFQYSIPCVAAGQEAELTKNDGRAGPVQSARVMCGMEHMHATKSKRRKKNMRMAVETAFALMHARTDLQSKNNG
jgi:hypothetical protein